MQTASNKCVLFTLLPRKDRRIAAISGEPRLTAADPCASPSNPGHETLERPPTRCLWTARGWIPKLHKRPIYKASVSRMGIASALTHMLYRSARACARLLPLVEEGREVARTHVQSWYAISHPPYKSQNWLGNLLWRHGRALSWVDDICLWCERLNARTHKYKWGRASMATSSQKCWTIWNSCCGVVKMLGTG